MAIPNNPEEWLALLFFLFASASASGALSIFGDHRWRFWFSNNGLVVPMIMMGFTVIEVLFFATQITSGVGIFLIWRRGQIAALKHMAFPLLPIAINQTFFYWIMVLFIARVCFQWITFKAFFSNQMLIIASVLQFIVLGLLAAETTLCWLIYWEAGLLVLFSGAFALYLFILLVYFAYNTPYLKGTNWYMFDPVMAQYNRYVEARKRRTTS